MRKVVLQVICAAVFGICCCVGGFAALDSDTAPLTASVYGDVVYREDSAAAQVKALSAETTEFVLEFDVNKRYTDISDDTQTEEENDGETLRDPKKTAYIAVLCAALAVAIVVLAVSLKRVPKEENIDISGKANEKSK